MPQGKPPIFTVLVAQVYQKTAFAPDADVDEILARWISNLSVTADQHGAHLIRSMENSLRCAFDRADQAIQCACSLQDAVSKASVAVSLRVGLDIGPVTFKNNDYACEAATRAGMLATQAHRDRIALSETAFEQLTPTIREAVSAGSVGAEGEKAYEVDWQAVDLPEFAVEVGPGGTTLEQVVTVQLPQIKRAEGRDETEQEGAASQDSKSLTIPLTHLRDQFRRERTREPQVAKAAPMQMASAVRQETAQPQAPVGMETATAPVAPSAGAGQTQAIQLPADQFCVALEGRITVLDRGHPRATIGRVPGNDIICNVDSTSRKHAEITERRGEWILVDYSRNGTLVYAADEGREELAHRSEVRLGKCGAISLGCPFEGNMRSLFFWLGHPAMPPPLLKPYLDQE